MPPKNSMDNKRRSQASVKSIKAAVGKKSLSGAPAKKSISTHESKVPPVTNQKHSTGAPAKKSISTHESKVSPVTNQKHSTGAPAKKSISTHESKVPPVTNQKLSTGAPAKKSISTHESKVPPVTNQKHSTGAPAKMSMPSVHSSAGTHSSVLVHSHDHENMNAPPHHQGGAGDADISEDYFEMYRKVPNNGEGRLKPLHKAFAKFHPWRPKGPWFITSGYYYDMDETGEVDHGHGHAHDHEPPTPAPGVSLDPKAKIKIYVPQGLIESDVRKRFPEATKITFDHKAGVEVQFGTPEEAGRKYGGSDLVKLNQKQLLWVDPEPYQVVVIDVPGKKDKEIKNDLPDLKQIQWYPGPDHFGFFRKNTQIALVDFKEPPTRDKDYGNSHFKKLPHHVLQYVKQKPIKGDKFDRMSDAEIAKLFWGEDAGFSNISGIVSVSIKLVGLPANIKGVELVRMFRDCKKCNFEGLGSKRNAILEFDKPIEAAHAFSQARKAKFKGKKVEVKALPIRLGVENTAGSLASKTSIKGDPTGRRSSKVSKKKTSVTSKKSTSVTSKQKHP